MPSIRFFNEGVRFSIPHQRKTSSWIKESIKLERQSLGDLNFIFCTDEFLRSVNVDYLNHDFYTDVITFDNSEEGSILSGDIFISIDRVKENALELAIPFETELHRVIIHGVLHLAGYSDKNRNKKALMRKKEDAYLSLWR
ncbi:MAG: rRNA maturation RNase YbeY [Chryseolinea sp.]